MSNAYVVVIAGGKGERFWPQSRSARPKHLLPIVGDTPMLAQTLDRVRDIAPPERTFVITSASQEKGVRSVCRTLPRGNIVVEPVGRDTAPAVALAAALVGARDPDGVFAVLPADHVIHDTDAYVRDLRTAFAAAAAADVLVTIGIVPSEPATGFGYVKRGGVWKKFDRRPVYKVERFVEKPPLETAKAYLESGDYLWNAGMFVWRAGVVAEALERHAPELHAGLAPVRDALARGRPLAAVLRKAYPTLTKISVDFALLEKASNVVMVPSSFDWDDVGSWQAVPRHHPADAAGNVTRGSVVVEDGRNHLVFSTRDHLVAVLGGEDLIVIHTDDATLVAPKSKAQDIKALLRRVEALPKGGALL